MIKIGCLHVVLIITPQVDSGGLSSFEWHSHIYYVSPGDEWIRGLLLLFSLFLILRFDLCGFVIRMDRGVVESSEPNNS